LFNRLLQVGAVLSLFLPFKDALASGYAQLVFECGCSTGILENEIHFKLTLTLKNGTKIDEEFKFNFDTSKPKVSAREIRDAVYDRLAGLGVKVGVPAKEPKPKPPLPGHPPEDSPTRLAELYMVGITEVDGEHVNDCEQLFLHLHVTADVVRNNFFPGSDKVRSHSFGIRHIEGSPLYNGGQFVISASSLDSLGRTMFLPEVSIEVLPGRTAFEIEFQIYQELRYAGWEVEMNADGLIKITGDFLGNTVTSIGFSFKPNPIGFEDSGYPHWYWVLE